jgi:hypothetical protein
MDRERARNQLSPAPPNRSSWWMANLHRRGAQIRGFGA